MMQRPIFKSRDHVNKVCRLIKPTPLIETSPESMVVEDHVVSLEHPLLDVKI